MNQDLIQINQQHRDTAQSDLRKMLSEGISGVVSQRLADLGWEPPAGIFAISTKRFAVSEHLNSSVLAYFDRDAANNLVLKAIDSFDKTNNFAECLIIIPEYAEASLVQSLISDFSAKVQIVIDRLYFARTI